MLHTKLLTGGTSDQISRPESKSQGIANTDETRRKNEEKYYLGNLRLSISRRHRIITFECRKTPWRNGWRRSSGWDIRVPEIDSEKKKKIVTLFLFSNSKKKEAPVLVQIAKPS
jgi:hypothetical protein